MRFLASEPLDQLAGGGNAQVFKKSRRNEPIDQDGVGQSQGIVAAQGDQVGRSRTGPDNVDFPCVCQFSPSCIRFAKVRRTSVALVSVAGRTLHK